MNVDKLHAKRCRAVLARIDARVQARWDRWQHASSWTPQATLDRLHSRFAVAESRRIHAHWLVDLHGAY